MKRSSRAGIGIAAVALALLAGLLIRDGNRPIERPDATTSGETSPHGVPALAPRLAAGPGASRRAAVDTKIPPTPVPPDEHKPKEDEKPEGTLAGVVVNADGKPVAGLGIAVVKARVLGWDALANWEASMIGREGQRDAGQALPLDRPAVRVLTTDDQGRFRADGIEDGREYRIRSRSASWRVRESPGRRRAADEPVVVVPAVSRRVRFVSDQERVPLPEKFDIRVSGLGYGTGLTTFSPNLVLTVDAEKAASGPVPFVVTAEPEGFLPEHKTVEVTGEAVQPEFEFRLHPVAKSEQATVEFLLASTDAAFLKRPFDIEVRDPTDPDLEVARSEVERGADGRLRATVPPGHWFLRLRPGDGWCNSVYWEGLQTLGAGRATTVTWTVPPHGSARIRLSPLLRLEHASGLVLTPPGGGTSSVGTVWSALSSDGDRVQALTAGDWKARVSGDGFRTLGERSFTVKAGEEVEVALDP